MLNVLAPHRNDQLNELKHNFAGIQVGENGKEREEEEEGREKILIYVFSQERFYAESSQATTTVFGGVMETVRSCFFLFPLPLPPLP